MGAAVVTPLLGPDGGVPGAVVTPLGPAVLTGLPVGPLDPGEGGPLDPGGGGPLDPGEPGRVTGPDMVAPAAGFAVRISGTTRRPRRPWPPRTCARWPGAARSASGPSGGHQPEMPPHPGVCRQSAYRPPFLTRQFETLLSSVLQRPTDARPVCGQPVRRGNE